MAWSKQYPVTAWERERNARIDNVVGYPNKFVTGERTWGLGYKPKGEGASALDASKAASGQVARVQEPSKAPLAAVTGGEVIGNHRSEGSLACRLPELRTGFGEEPNSVWL